MRACRACCAGVGFLTAPDIARVVGILLEPCMLLVHSQSQMLARGGVATLKHLTCIAPRTCLGPVVDYALAALNPDAVDRSYQECC